MLVLSRKRNEVIVVNDDVIIQILSIDQNKVRLGITAPKGVPIHRQEILDRIRTAAAPPAERVQTVWGETVVGGEG